MEISLQESKQNKVKIVPERWYGRLFYAFVTIISPAMALAIQHGFKSGQADWQSGPNAYFEILLGGGINRLFYPFILYAVISMILLLLSPQRFAPHFAVRLGIYTGTVLAAQCTLLMLVTKYFLFALMMGMPATFILYGVYKGHSIGVKRWGLNSILWGLVLFLAAIIVLLAMQTSFLVVLLGLWMLGFCWILPLTAVTSWRLWITYEAPKLWNLSHAMVASALAGAYMVAWLQALGRMMELYESLPNHPSLPNCYIATAAAKGHPQLVGSRKVGSVMVNRQLQTLKAAEMVLLVMLPRCHRWLRRRYDVYGRFLATKLTNPYLADIAYLTLKPFEWGSRLLLSLVVPGVDGWIGRFYVPNNITFADHACEQSHNLNQGDVTPPSA